MHLILMLVLINLKILDFIKRKLKFHYVKTPKIHYPRITSVFGISILYKCRFIFLAFGMYRIGILGI